MALGSIAYAEEVNLISAPAADYVGHWAESTIQKWMEAGKISGYSDGSYKPDNNITRAEFVKLVNGTIDFNKKATIAYKDVTTADWFYNYVGIAQEIGYISGYSKDSFGPNDYITREEAASILARIQYLNGNVAAADKFSDKTNVSSWAVESVGAASDAGFITGYNDGTFRPSNKLTRAEALTMLDNVLVNAKNVVIYKDGTELKDKVVEGDLIIAKTVGEGNVHLTNVVVKGEIKVLGGGLNSVYFNNVKVSNIEVLKDKVRLVFADGSVIENLTTGTETVLENTDGTIAKISVSGDGEVTLTGDFGEVTVTGSSNITLDDAVITKLVVDQPITIEGTGTITTLQANADGIQYEAEVTITKTVTGEGVTEAPAVVVEAPAGGGGGAGGPIGEPTYRIAVSASIDSTTYNPLMTTDTYDGTQNISTFLQVEALEILGTNNSKIDEIIGKINNRLSGMTINGVGVNTAEGLEKIQANLAGTGLVNGFDGIFSDSDSEISEIEMEAILNAFQLSDLDKFSSINISKTVAYNGNEVDPVMKVNGVVKTREELKSFLIAAGKSTIDNFFSTYGTSVKVEVIRGARTATLTITRVE
jgi:hypothetical protein